MRNGVSATPNISGVSVTTPKAMTRHTMPNTKLADCNMIKPKDSPL